jgi:type IV pilus assembly protein PilX
MATNLYDRDLAFQSAEAAIQAGQAELLQNPNPVGAEDCSPTSIVACKTFPTNTFSASNLGWKNITDTYSVNANQRIGTPQYNIQMLGEGSNGLAFGQMNSANNTQYGVNPGVFNQQFYRITARSSNTSDAQERAVVVLQATIRRSM